MDYITLLNNISSNIFGTSILGIDSGFWLGMSVVTVIILLQNIISWVINPK